MPWTHLEVVPGDLVRAGHPCQGEDDQGQEGGDGEREQLQDPVDRHHQDRVQGPQRLAVTLLAISCATIQIISLILRRTLTRGDNSLT